MGKGLSLRAIESGKAMPQALVDEVEVSHRKMGLTQSLKRV